MVPGNARVTARQRDAVGDPDFCGLTGCARTVAGASENGIRTTGGSADLGFGGALFLFAHPAADTLWGKLLRVSTSVSRIFSVCAVFVEIFKAADNPDFVVCHIDQGR